MAEFEFEFEYSEKLKHLEAIKEDRENRYQNCLDFIYKNIKVRECVKFRLKSDRYNSYRDNSYDECVCNRIRYEHKNRHNTEEEWTHENNTETRSRSREDVETNDDWIKAIRFDCVEKCDSTCDNLIALLADRDKLNVPLPGLIISIFAGSKGVNFISDQQKKNFKQGLIDVIKKNNTWVLVEGFNRGVQRLVSDTVHEFRLRHEDLKDQVTLIGISSWDTYDTRYYLSRSQKPKVEFEFPYDYHLLCDDGTKNPRDKEAAFRLKFEVLVKKKAKSSRVHILFNGDMRTITNSLTALKDQVPLVVIEGSGGAADVISEVMKLPNKDKNDEEGISTIVMNDKWPLGIRHGTDTESEITRCLAEMYRRYRKRIVVSDMRDASVNLEQEIFRAIILGADHGLCVYPVQILECCIRLNCADVAKSVFSDPNYADFAKEQIERLFIYSLKQNKPEFVDLFLGNYLRVEQISDKTLLRKLYKVSLDPAKSIFGDLLKDLADDTNSSVGLKKKNGKLKHNILLYADHVIKKLSGNILNNRYGDKVSTEAPTDHKGIPLKKFSEKEKEGEDPHSHEIHTAEDLFLWALLSEQISLSLILWKNCKYHIGSALIAALILQKMASLVLKRGNNTLQLKFMEASEKYEKLAISILNQSYNMMKLRAYLLTIRQLPEWNNLTCLDIAIHGDMKVFLNHSTCRSYTAELWMGHLYHKLPTWKILVCIPFGLFLMRPLIMPYLIIPSKLEKRSNEAEPDKTKQQLVDREKLKFKRIPFGEATKIFYRAPIVKFYIHLFSYILFLLVFSYTNLVELKPRDEVKHFKNVTAEIIVYIFLFSFTIEECRQVLVQKCPGCIPKVRKHLSDIWNKLDVFIIFISIAGIVTRFTISKEHFSICRCFYSVTLSMFFLRSMQFYFVNRSIGPKVYMIQHMLRDILFFLGIFVIFIMSYGTLAQALRFPNSKFELALFKDIVYMPYFQTYGELMLDTLEVAAPCNGTDCVVKSAVVVFGFAIFLLLTNVLLINLLIAMFGYTFNQIQADSENIWYYKRMQLVREIYDKPILPAPLNIFYYIYEMISYLRQTGPRFPRYVNQGYYSHLIKMGDYQLDTFEKYCKETVSIENREQTGCEFTDRNPEVSVNAQLDRIEKLIEMIGSKKI